MQHGTWEEVPAKSLPLRGAWIEIDNSNQPKRSLSCRSPCGERGLKLEDGKHILVAVNVAPPAGSVD